MENLLIIDTYQATQSHLNAIVYEHKVIKKNATIQKQETTKMAK